MTHRASALFDVERLRERTDVLLAPLGVSRPTIVLGSRQSIEVLELAAVKRDGVDLRRRHGGGGAVLLRPGDCWVEVWLPARSASRHDVRADAVAVGEWWRTALSTLGVDTDVHRGALVDAEFGTTACFAGLGPGEVTIGARKLLGLSQWRSRHGALVSSVVPMDPPSELLAYLVAPDALASSLRAAPGLGAAAPTVTTANLVQAFRGALAVAYPHAIEDVDTFS